MELSSLSEKEIFESQDKLKSEKTMIDLAKVFKQYNGHLINYKEEVETIQYLQLRQELINRGYKEEIEWSENIKPCKSKGEFFSEYVYVVINSGMKAQIARKIYNKVSDALICDVDINTVFGHKGKCKAIMYVKENLEYIYAIIQAGFADGVLVLDYLESLPFIGKITKYHLAKNMGYAVCKPDRHLVRIAKNFGLTPIGLCNKIATRTGDRIAAIDTVLWRSANLGLI